MPPLSLPPAAASARLGPRLGIIAALLGAASVMAQAAADAQFLSALGPSQVGAAIAASSALLAVVLATLGGAGDRAGRARLLPVAGALSAAGLLLLAALASFAPTAAAWVGFIGVKQLAAACELAFWMLASEQLDARQSVRALPRLAAASGAGAALCASLAVPLARAGGASAVLVGAAALFLCVAAAAALLPAQRRVAVERASPGGSLVGVSLGRSLRDGVAALRGSRLARQLAVLVAIAGAFSTLLFLELAQVAAARHDSDNALAALLSTVRSAGAVLTFVAQLVIAPVVLRRLGTGAALLVSPAWALVAVGVFACAPALVGVAVVAAVARGLDQALETPAQRLVHTLLPPAIRGRAVGAVEGLAKRGGAIAAGLVGGALVAWPVPFAVLAAAIAAAYVASALAMARRLPSLAVAAPASGLADGGVGAVTHSPSLGPRALDALAREAAGPREHAVRAAELLAELARRGQPHALVPLWAAAGRHGDVELWRLATCAVASTAEAALPAHGLAPPALDALEQDAAVAAVVAVSLCPAPLPYLAAQARDARPAVALAASLAALYATDAEAALRDVSDELRHGDRATQQAAVLSAASWARRAAAERAPQRVLAAAWPLLAAARRERAALEARLCALDALIEIAAPASGAAAAEVALFRAQLWDAALALAERRPPSVVAPALAVRGFALLGLLGASKGQVSAKDSDEAIALAAGALADRDEEVAEAASSLLTSIGVPAMAELLVVIGYGRRAARDRAAALLRALPATAPALEQVIERELSALESTVLAEGALADGEPASLRPAAGALLRHRLGDRAREIGHSILLLVAAQRRLAAVAQAALSWRHARGRGERARALAVLDATLPRQVALRLLEAIDERPAAARARAIAARTGRPLPAQAELISAELRGGDALARRIVLGALDSDELAAHRGDVAAAATSAAATADPRRLLSRLVATDEAPGLAPEEGRDMPSHVETLLVLSKITLFAELTTRQLDELARRARWQSTSAGAVIAVRGQVLLALVLVESGALTCGARRIAAGDVVDELAWVAPRAPDDDVVVVEPGRIAILERQTFEELADDVPGLGAALCRALGERLRASAERGATPR